MLYIINAFIYIAWAIYVKRKGNIDWHKTIAIYALTVIIVDFPEIIFSTALGCYEFPTKLLADPIKDNQLGIIFSDGIILPMAGIVFYYYINRYKGNKWILIFAFVAIHIVLELVYLSLGYLEYNKWHILYSTICYIIGFRAFAYFFTRYEKNTIPYWMKTTVFLYPAFSWWGSVLSGGLLSLYQFRLHIFSSEYIDDRMTDVGIVWVSILFHAVFISHLKTPLRKYVYIIEALAVSLFCIWLNTNGLLIYHNWNHIFTIFRWSIPFLLLFIYDNWEEQYHIEQSRNRQY